MTTAYWREQGRAYLDHGWPIIPIRPGAKRPTVSDWQNLRVDVPTWQRMAANGSAECGIGVQTGPIVGVDVDCSDEQAIRSVHRWCVDHIGEPLVRWGNMPKMLLVYRTERPQPKRTSAAYLGPGGEKFRIEILGNGQQFVAAGVHPDTRQEYRWRGRSPLDTAISDLIEIPDGAVDELFAAWDEVARVRGWSPVGTATASNADRPGVGATPFERHRPAVGAPLEQAREILQAAHLDWSDYDTWLQAGQALHHEYAGDDVACDLWDDLSAVAPNYQGGVCHAKWRTFNDAGAAGVVTLRTFIQRAQQNGYVWHVRARVDALPDAPTGIRKWLTTDPPPVEWLVPDLLPLGTVGGLVARGGTGKSFASLQLAYAVATGTGFLGHWPAGDPAPVLALMAEEDEAALHRRMHPISIANAPFLDVDRDLSDLTELAVCNLDIHPRFGLNNLLTEKLGSVVAQTPLVENIIERAQRRGCRLIIVDPIMAFRGGDENSQEDVARFVDVLTRINRETGATVLAVHHSRKTRDDAMDQDAARGASAFTNGLRWQANMTGMTPGEAKRFGIHPDVIGSFVQFGVTKNNYGPPQAPVWLERGAHGVLSRVALKPADQAKEVGRSGLSVGDVQERILAIVKGERARGNRLSIKALQRQYGGTNGTLGIAQGRVYEVVADMINRGLLVETPGANSTRTLEVRES